MIDSFSDLLATLSERSLTVRRLNGDQVGVAGSGELTQEIADAIKQYKLELLALLPDQTERMLSLYQTMLQEVDQLCPPEWFGTAEMWSILDQIDDEIDAAIASGDQQRLQAGLDEYKLRAESFFLIDELFDDRWDQKGTAHANGM